MLLPGSFIPAAERTGRIVDVDRWVMRAAITKLAELSVLAALVINVSARSFDDPTLAGTTASLLAEFHVEPRRLIVELTETRPLANMQTQNSSSKRFGRWAARFAPDDFGCRLFLVRLPQAPLGRRTQN
ncbi:MAG: EAL domain-containing protein [Dechloromonas sp.]|uniref:EAL domain-containing protein n=1 Tax=Candidatus Dechloromonas phosphorivorans TaxID=2899244 RepID=A0A935JY43_9RHOO|nr:EAL domain-containing protein [Candidatus Dechloromonas phosphorivorans]